ncbi:MAG: secretion protein HlyD, partial [Boseongicola sp.]|nr:secretion protein HlyD [Boseongicola sp.]
MRDKLFKKTYEFEPWQFFVLEVLPGCEDFAKLASVFEDRFGQPLKQEQLDGLLASVADRNLLQASADHALLKPYLNKRYETTDGKAVVKSFRAAASGGPAVATLHVPPASVSTTGAEDETAKELPPGVNDAFGLDERAARKIWTLFNPKPILRLLSPIVAPLRFAVYPLPFLALAALFLSIKYRHLIGEDMTRLLGEMTFFEHAAYSMVSVNLLVTFTVAFIAYRFRATVSAFGIGVFFGFF